MKKNLSTVTIKPPVLSVRGVNSPQNKKIEGFDKFEAIQTFKSKVERIKNQPKNQTLED